MSEHPMTALAEKVEGLRMTKRRLRILRAGSNSHVGRAGHCYLAGMSERVWNDNAERLVKAGFLASHERHWFVITDKGRAFLRALENDNG